MPAPLRLGLAGLGTVGIGVVKIVQAHAELIAARAGRPVAITAVSARDRARARPVPVSGLRWYDDPVALAADPGLDVIVEAIGENATRVRQRGQRWDPQTGQPYEADITEYIYFGDWSDVPIEEEGTPSARPSPRSCVGLSVRRSCCSARQRGASLTATTRRPPQASHGRSRRPDM